MNQHKCFQNLIYFFHIAHSIRKTMAQKLGLYLLQFLRNNFSKLDPVQLKNVVRYHVRIQPMDVRIYQITRVIFNLQHLQVHHQNGIVLGVILSTRIARYDHFEVKYGQQKVQFIHNSAFSRPSKSGFAISSLVRCDKTIHTIVLKFFVVLDIGLGIVNQFLYCKYLLNS